MNFKNRVPGFQPVPGQSAELGSFLDGSFVGSGSRAWPLFLLTVLVLVALPLAPVFGQGGPTNGGAGDDWGDDETTLPLGVDPGTGLILVGTLGNIHRAVESITGPGDAQFYELDPRSSDGIFLVVLHGNLRLDLDQSALAEGRIQIYFSSGAHLLGGMAQASVGNHGFSPFVLDEMVYELPLAQFYDSATASPVFGLFAMGPDFARYRLSARGQGGVVQITQRSGF